MNEPYVYATLPASLDKIHSIVTDLCEIMVYRVTSTEKPSENMINMRLTQGKRTPRFTLYWTININAHIFPKGMLVLISAKPHNQFLPVSCLHRLSVAQQFLDMLKTLFEIL